MKGTHDDPIAELGRNAEQKGTQKLPGGEKLEELGEGAREEGGEEREVVWNDGGLGSGNGSISSSDHLVHGEHQLFESQRERESQKTKMVSNETA